MSRIHVSSRVLTTALVVALFGAISTPAVHAGATPAQKCQAFKLKSAGKACQCRLSALATAARKGGPADFAKCTSKLTDAFGKAEEKAAGVCPTTADDAAIDVRMDDLATAVDFALDEGATEADALKCRAAKLKAAAKKCSCLHKARAKAAARNGIVDFAKCETKFAGSIAKADLKGGAACPSTATVESLCSMIDAGYAEVDADLSNVGTDDLAARGRYGVGFTELTLVDATRSTDANGTYAGASDRTLDVTIWYPADVSTQLSQKREGPIAGEGGAFPLLVRAHGFSGFRDDSKGLVQHLASHGYIVVAPDFPLSRLFAPGGPTLLDVDEQAGDLSYLIDTMEAFNVESASRFFGRVSTDTIGAIGHSLGGATVAVAGYHVDLRDPRIDAVVALAPLGCVLLDTFFNGGAPLMIQGGTIDLITEYNGHHLRAYNFADTPKYLVEMFEGTHLGFNDLLAFNANENGDEAVGCNLFVGPGEPRPVSNDVELPPDYLGGEPAGIDTTASECPDLCPPAPPTHMLHARQQVLSKASSVAFFDAKLRGSVSGARLITGRLDSDNADVTLFFEE